MRKKLVALAVAGVVALTLVGTANATSSPTLAQFKRLKARVVRIDDRLKVAEARLTCLDTTFSITNHKGTQYAEYDPATDTYSGSEPFDWFDTNPNPVVSGFIITQTTTSYDVVTDDC